MIKVQSLDPNIITKELFIQYFAPQLLIKLTKAHIYNLIDQKLTKLLKFLEQKKIKVISVIKELINKHLSTITGKIYSECEFEIKLKLLN